jgi:hypothetical protein
MLLQSVLSFLENKVVYYLLLGMKSCILVAKKVVYYLESEASLHLEHAANKNSDPQAGFSDQERSVTS